ncbi:copper amine oxidase [Haloechinothrix sp. YIM 98757]|uniref:Copper amine oxidase n=1 Tax=Haloechinothrix aidingensis TaxID=2752311 RepID=A0A838ACW0_9PSEU|nr:copper amine oxidase [Haloechinothrix aidingensis]MBA0127116.1 copper amine oxidase [Haloechinothrix aidingensis]
MSLVALPAAGVMLLSACGGTGGTAAPVEPAAGTDGGGAAQTAGDLTAEDLRITLERQLGQHAMLAVEAMRAGVAGQDHFDAAAASLEKNTEDLTDSIGAVYGDEGAEKFNELWSNHIDFFVQYTTGVAEDDQEAQDEAIERLDQYREDFGGFLDGATEGELPQNAVADLLQDHVDQLVSQVDAYAAEDYAGAAEQTREAYAHMFGTAQGLTNAIVATQDGISGDPESPDVELRSDLGKLLGEHAQTAMQAMRAGVSGQDDFDAIAGALDANTRDLTGAISGVFGAEGGQAFMGMWADHIDFFVQYTVGLAEGDEQAKEEALQRLEQYREDFSQFLDGASDGSIPAEVVAEGLQKHVDDLVDQVDAFESGEYDSAYGSAYDAYNHMYGTAEALSGGIVDFMGGEMPAGGVETGGGGTTR